jgi:hypothetical protein
MANIRTDEKYIGGRVFENLGPRPVTVYSEQERRKIMRERGLEESIYAFPDDKHVKTWAQGMGDYDNRPMCMLSDEEAAQRKAEWWADETVKTV